MLKTYLERLSEVVSVDRQHADVEKDIMEMLEVSKPVIFDGHFQLLSGRHSDKFFRFAAITQYPYYVSLISKAMVTWLKAKGPGNGIDVVLSPASQGMFFAYDIARELSSSARTRAVYAAIEDDGCPSLELVDGFQIKPGERVLVVNDMTTTGSGLETLVNIVHEAKASVVGICIFANRGVDEAKVKNLKAKFLFHSIVELNMPSWDAKDCKAKCLGARPLIHAKQLHHLPIYESENAYEKYIKRLEVA